MWELLFYAYLANGTLLIVHEIDSAYWKEWELFRLPGGPGGFVLMHLPLVLLILWGAVGVEHHWTAGIVVSFLMAAGGIFAYAIHTWFLRKGRPEFDTSVSRGILTATLVASLVQTCAALLVLA